MTSHASYIWGGGYKWVKQTKTTDTAAVCSSNRPRPQIQQRCAVRTDQNHRYSSIVQFKQTKTTDKQRCAVQTDQDHSYSSGVQFKQTKTTDTAAVCSSNRPRPQIQQRRAVQTDQDHRHVRESIARVLARSQGGLLGPMIQPASSSPPALFLFSRAFIR